MDLEIKDVFPEKLATKCLEDNKITINEEVAATTSPNQITGCKSGSVEDETSGTDIDLPSTSSNQEETNPQKNDERESDPNSFNANSYLNSSVKLYAEDKGPQWYSVKGNIVTPPIITKNLPEAFKFLPVYGMPKSRSKLEEFQNAKVREFVGCDLGDEEYEKLAAFCSPEHLKMGTELVMSTNYPIQGPLPEKTVDNLEMSDAGDSLCIVKKLKLRMEKDVNNHYTRRLKYRGVRIIPPVLDDDYKISLLQQPLEPGKDLVFRIRIYRPFKSHVKERNNTRHSVFSNDILMLGRQKLSLLRDRIVCANDVGMRLDVSGDPDDLPSTSAKDIFPSGFLFINNVFYVDTRDGCMDISKPIREWAFKRRLGKFPYRDMRDVTLDQLEVKLGHPEVYVHQGRCEHLFSFSSVRLYGAADPRAAAFPAHGAASHNQTVYCATCAEFGARWIVAGCPLVPFDPAFFCDTCLKLYLYVGGKKICDFKAYSYRGNEISVLKPAG